MKETPKWIIVPYGSKTSLALHVGRDGSRVRYRRFSANGGKLHGVSSCDAAKAHLAAPGDKRIHQALAVLLAESPVKKERRPPQARGTLVKTWVGSITARTLEKPDASIATVPKAGVEGLGQRIAKRRRELGKSVRQLARECGVSDFAVRSWENMETTPDARHLDRLGEALKVSPAWLGDWPEGKSALSPAEIAEAIASGSGPLERTS